MGRFGYILYSAPKPLTDTKASSNVAEAC